MWLVSVEGLQREACPGQGQQVQEAEPQPREAGQRPQEAGSQPASSPALLPPSGRWGCPGARCDCPPPSAENGMKCLMKQNLGRVTLITGKSNTGWVVGNPWHTEHNSKPKTPLIFTTLAVTPERQLWICKSQWLSTQDIIINTRTKTEMSGVGGCNTAIQW